MTAVEEAREHLEDALALLPSEQRQVLELRVVQTLSYQEIADRLGVSAEVVRARSSRGLKALRSDDRVHQAARALGS